MSQLKRTIIFLGILCFIFVGISYVISINMEVGFLSINSSLISNNFLFTCFSGAFASILVLLATEIYRFIQVKKDFEQFLFSQLAFIYGQLQIASTHTFKLLNKSDLVPNNLLGQLSNTLSQITPSLRSLDYNTFISTNKSRIVNGILNRLFSTEISQMDELSRICIYLPMAICTDKMDLLNKEISNPVITSISPNTQKALKVLYKEISQLKAAISIDITELNAACNNRFHWNAIERGISNMPEPDSSLEAFFSKHNLSSEGTNE